MNNLSESNMQNPEIEKPYFSHFACLLGRVVQNISSEALRIRTKVPKSGPEKVRIKHKSSEFEQPNSK